MNTPAHRHYNIGWLDDEDLVNAFVARRGEYSFLRDELARVPPDGNVQHYLLVGVRGAGKTTMLKRLAVAMRRDTDLSDHLIALSFPEELYQVKNLADFWWAACEALADELDRLGLKSELDALDAAMFGAKTTRSASEPLSNTGLEVLLQICRQLHRRPVLLVDNLDMVFERIDKTGRKLNDKDAPAYWALREALSTRHSPVVIGGSVRLSESFTSYDAAFYDFFLPKRLGKLTLEEVWEVLERLADAQGLSEIKERLRARPGRIETLFELTGGNPRALGLIFELLRNGPNSRAVEDFERLMDLTTPYYKARIEDLSEQAQVIMHALAVRGADDGLRFGHTAAEVGLHAGLPTTSVSAQLTILEHEGLVEKSTAHGKAQYRIAEQLFRLWLQMRGTRRIRQNVILLTKFFEAMYDLDELNAKLRDDCGASALAEAKYAFAIAGTQHADVQRKELEAYGTDRLQEHLANHGGNLDDYLPVQDRLIDIPVKGGEDESNLSLIVALFEKGRQAIADEEFTEAEKAFREAIELLPTKAAPWVALGISLGLSPHRNLEAEMAYRKAVELEPDFGMGWQHLGDLLASDPARHKEAAEALRTATEKAPDQAAPWRSFGILLATSSFEQLDAAESALRKSLEISPDDTHAMVHLARVLMLQEGRDAAAEVYLRRAIDLEPDNASILTLLGGLLSGNPAQAIEAEQVLTKAISIDPSYGSAWLALGMAKKATGRHDEVEATYRRGTELLPENPDLWLALGSVLARSHQYEEAEIALRKAKALNPTDLQIFRAIGVVLAALGKDEEALASLEVGVGSDQVPAPMRELLVRLRLRKLLEPAKDAVSRKDIASLRQALASVLTADNEPAEALVSVGFVEEFLKPILSAPDLAAVLLTEMRNLGYEKYGKPLLLALEAALSNREDMLGELEPELQNATKRMFGRLTGAAENQKRTKSGKKSRRKAAG